THPRDRTAMLVGMGIAGLGFIALPVFSAVFVTAWQPGISDHAADQRRVAAVVGGAAANSLLGIGIPFWAHGAASPGDWRPDAEPPPGPDFAIEPGPFGVSGTF